MSIIVSASTKGGPGKTTLAMCLASYWHDAGVSVKCIDADPNKNLSQWLGRAGQPFPCAVVGDDDVVQEAESASEAFDAVIIDVAGSQGQALVYAAGVADLVLIPTRPDFKDIMEAIRTQQFVKNAEQMMRRRIPDFRTPHFAVLTQVNRRAVVTEHSRSQLESLGLSALAADLPSRTAYSQSSFAGASPLADQHIRADVEAMAVEITRKLEEAHG